MHEALRAWRVLAIPLGCYGVVTVVLPALNGALSSAGFARHTALVVAAIAVLLALGALVSVGIGALRGRFASGQRIGRMQGLKVPFVLCGRPSSAATSAITSGVKKIPPSAILRAVARQASKQELHFMFARLRQLVRAHPVAAFYALAFPLSWRAYVVALFHRGGDLGLDPYGPLVAAVVVTALAGGWTGLRTWARTLIRWRAPLSLYAFAVLVPLALTLLGIGANLALGARPPPAAAWTSWPSLFVVFPLVMVLGGPLGEEPAWRGLALARVAERRPMLQASLAVGLVWFAWHLPLLLARPAELAPGFIGILSASVVFGWLYQRSAGAVLLPLLMHTAQNTFGGEFAGPMFQGADVTRLAWIRGIFYVALAGVLVLRDARLRAAPTVEEPPRSEPRIAA